MPVLCVNSLKAETIRFYQLIEYAESAQHNRDAIPAGFHTFGPSCTVLRSFSRTQNLSIAIAGIVSKTR